MSDSQEPKKLNNREVKHQLAIIAPWILIFDLFVALMVYLFKDSLFTQEEAYLAGLISSLFVVAGIFSFAILRMMSTKLTRTRK